MEIDFDAADRFSDFVTVPAGTYLLRLQVDGVASALTTNPAGQYDGPLVTIP